MNGLARAVLIGNLVRDPELRSTRTGTSVCQIAVAVNERVKRGDNWEDYVSFYDCTVWAGQGEAVAKHLSKGSPVAVDGRLTQERWQDKDGNNRQAVKVTADRVTFLPSGERRDNGGNGRSEPQQDLGSATAAAPADDPLDIPFARPRIPDRETRRRDLFTGDRRWAV